MTPEEALKFIHAKSWQASKPGLSRTRELLEKLGNPQDRLKFVHIAGTNGKGSTAAMTASVLTAAGYRTGLYTSPYIQRFNERMQIDGEQIPDAELAALTERIAPLALSMEDRPTEFELVTALGLLWFYERCCDIVVLEVGMGGRLDSTNAIPSPEVAVVTSIGLDHTRELGDTVEKIAAEKAAIIKHGCTAVLYAQKPSVEAVVARRCEGEGVPLLRADAAMLTPLSDGRDGQSFSYNGLSLKMKLLGAHQLRNAAVVLQIAEALRSRGWHISNGALASGFESALWPARFEILSREPYFVVDGGHNPQCAEAVAANLRRYFPGMRRVLLIGVLADKDYGAMMDVLAPEADEFVTVAPFSPRALSARALAEHLARYGKPVRACDDIPTAVAAAARAAGKGGMVCSVGSLYMSGAVREAVVAQRQSWEVKAD